nr:hypothetical protein [Tanacetum cinerariifolium]
SRKDKDKDEDPSAGSDRGWKNRKTSKDAEPAKGPKDKESYTLNDPSAEMNKMGTNPDWNVGKTPQQGQNQNWLMNLASSAKKPSKTFDELMGTPIDFFAFIMNDLNISNLTKETLLGPAFRLLKGTRGGYPFDLTKPLHLVKIGNHQKSPVKVAYDKHALWREQRKTFYAYARGLQSKHDVYSTKRILAVTQEGDFPRLHINDIEDMILLVVQNWLTNLSDDDISDFTIALRRFTRSLVIQKRVEDLQLEVESYQKKINVTNPETTKSRIRKRDPYTPYQDPQGFIYVKDSERNRLIHSDELYKFSDGTLTRLRTSLSDITKNISTEYLPKKICSTLEKKRANIMIKAIYKQLKERRMMRSLKKFVGGRDYRTDLRIIQQII